MKYSFNKYKYWITFLFLTFVSLTTPVSAVDYTISSVADWNKYAQQIASNNAAAVSANYTLEADLDFSDPATKFIPFGGLAVTAGHYNNMQGRMFNGKFDGKGHKLKGIHFGYATKTNMPFAVFGSSNGQIRNLIVEDMNLPENTLSKSSSVGGGICGYFTDGGSAIIENCAVVNSSMSLSANCAGGIVGQLNGGTIRNCVVENFIIRNDDGAGTQRGGIVGYVSGKSIIENCYANVDFKSAQKQTGGIIGFIGGTNLCTVRNCYATGHFKMMGGGDRLAVGGLVGEAKNLDIKNCGSSISIDILLLNAYAPQTTAGAFGKISSTISFDNIYATGQIEFSAPRKDPITGSKYDMAGINSFYGQANTGVTVNLPATCYSVDEYYKYLVDGDYVRSEADIVYGKPATLKPLSFVQSGCLAQQMNNDLGLSNVSDIVWIQNKDCFAGFPVPFGKQAELLALLKKLELVTDQFGNALPKCGDVETTFRIKTVADFEKYAQMVADEAADWSFEKTFIVDNDIEGAVTVCMGSETKPFLGTFDGGGHIINLSISGTTNVGLISVAGKTAKINNVQTKGSVTGSTNVGAVVGKALAGSAITGCANAAVVKGKTSVGGIVGNSAGMVSVSLNVATITGDEYVGGIAGTGFTLTNCANMGYIRCEKTSTTGGIAGSASDVVSYCFNGGYTEGAAIANEATLMGCAYDDALSIKGQTGTIVEHFSATSLIPITSWKSEAGLYPVPADLAATAIGKFATSVVYFSNKEKANAVCDSITANQTSWTNSSSVLKYNNKAYLPIAEGTTVLKYTDGGFTREIPIKVVAPGLFAGGFGNEFSPFIITKVAHLNQMATYVHQNNGAKGKVFELANDITDGVFDDVIGRSNLSAFYGTFRSSKGKLYNIPINNVSSSSSYALGLIGTNMGRIERISVTGILGCKGNGENATVGGIAGYSEGSIIECVSNVDITVSGYSYAGGICGRSIGAVLSCINIGNVTGESLTAGITCSKSTTSSLNVSNCYNGGVIKGRDVAGIVAMTGGSTSIKPVFENNINTGKVEGVKSDALVLVGGAAPLYKGGLFDAQHTLASSKVETAVADSTRKLVKESVVGWTSAANSYPQNLSYEVAKIASSPVFLNVLDSADNVKHDFSVATPTGVKWTSTTGCLSVQGDKVVRVKAGVDTLKATYGVYVRKVPVVVSCVWDTVVEPTVEYCNKYNGVTYTKDTELTVVDTTGTHDNADCGTVHIRIIKVKVGKQGQEMTYTGCGSYVYDGVEYKEDAVINNSSCDVITIKKITMPTSCTAVGYGAFYECTNLNELELPNNIDVIGSDMFYNCNNLEKLTIPSSVTKINPNAFYGCSKLKQIILPSNLKTIGKQCFHGCSSLESIAIPEGVEELPQSCFALCSNLKEIKLPNSLANIAEMAFAGDTALKILKLPQNVKVIEGGAFASCSGLENIIFPASLKTIGFAAFVNCSKIEVLTIPASVDSIGVSSIVGCESLKEIRIESAIPPKTNILANFNVSDTLQITVPDGKEEDFHKALGWKEFRHINKKVYEVEHPDMDTDINDRLSLVGGENMEENFLVYSSIANETKGETIIYDNSIYEQNEVDEKAHFVNGESALTTYLKSNVSYPAQAKGKRGIVVIGFVVEKDGAISNLKVKQSQGDELDAEAVSAVYAMPKWIAAQKDGQAVRSNTELKINVSK